MICPHCTNANVRRSQSSRWSDFLHSSGDRQAFRCRACRQRFFASPTSATPAYAARQPARKHHRHKSIETRKKRRVLRSMITVGVFLLMFAAFGFLLYYFTLGHAPASNQPDSMAPSE